MFIRVATLVGFIILLSCLKSNAQKSTYFDSSCLKVINDTIKSLDFIKETGILAKEEKDSIGVHLRILNKTTDTIFLFDSYFNNSNATLIKSPLTHRLNKPLKTYTISFLPFIYTLTTVHTVDYIIPDDLMLLRYGQVRYHFIAIPPNHSYSFYLSDAVLFPSKISKDFDINDPNEYKSVKIFSFEKEKIKGYKIFVELAYYNNIDFIGYNKKQNDAINSVYNVESSYKKILISW
jgi:hypothetical protein